MATAESYTSAYDLWRQIAGSEAFQRALVEVVGEAVSDVSPGRRALALEDQGVMALEGAYASALAQLHSADRAEFWQALRLTRQFGAPERCVFGWHASLEDLVHGPLAVFQSVEHVPTVTVHVNSEFFDRRADQRREVCQLLADLATAFDVRVVASGLVQRRLVKAHRIELPGVSEQCSAGPRAGLVAERVETARMELDPDGRETDLLRRVADETSETIYYHALYESVQTSRSRVRQCISELVEHDLVTTFDGTEGRAVELLAAGGAYLDTLDEEIGRQRRLSEYVSETGNRSDDSRVIPHAHEGPAPPDGESGGEGGTDTDRNRLPRYHQVRSAARHRYAAAAGSATDGGITLIDHPIGQKTDDRGEPHWYYDHDDDRLLVGAEYDNPMQWWVCIALALADVRTFRHVLTPERLESGKAGDLFANHTDLLRNSRCLGYLADADATCEAYADALQEAAEDLRELTRDYYHRNYEDHNSFRGEILREAHGLAGTIVHLLDLADVEVVREARLPRYSRDFDASDEAALAKTLTVGATIQSRYREFAAYRQLFETREEKRHRAIPPTVDAEDPFGELIGSFVLVGKGVDDIADPLRRRLVNQEPHEDAPEFAVRVPVEVADERRQVAQTVRMMCYQKSLRPIREAVSMLAALTDTPYDVARAVHNLAPETKVSNREIRLDEVRYALSTLDAERLLPEMGKPALSSIVHRLLTAESPLTQQEIADSAGVSVRSVRNHTERLAAFDFVHETDAGWRFVLPFHTDEERVDTLLPWYVTTADEQSETLPRDVLGEVVHDLLGPERYANPDDPVAGALFAGPGEVVPALRTAWEWLDPWLSAIRTLLGEGAGHAYANVDATQPYAETVATVGINPEQTSLRTAPMG